MSISEPLISLYNNTICNFINNKYDTTNDRNTICNNRAFKTYNTIERFDVHYNLLLFSSTECSQLAKANGLMYSEQSHALLTKAEAAQFLCQKGLYNLTTRNTSTIQYNSFDQKYDNTINACSTEYFNTI